MYVLGLGENDLEGKVEVKGVGERMCFVLLLELTMDTWSLGAFNDLSKECGLQWPLRMNKTWRQRSLCP